MSKTIDVLSPADQEGTRATVLRWLKKPGEAVAANEPLLELETDKVTVEIPAPVAGRLAEVLKQEKEEAEPGAVLGRVEVMAAGQAAAAEPSAPVGVEQTRKVQTSPASGEASALLSPAVKRLLMEHNLDASQIPASGKGGRLTAEDITRFVEQRAKTAPAGSALSRRIPHSAIRRRIAAHMVESVTTAPHVTTVFEADLSRVVAHRARHMQDFEARGAKLTYTAYFVCAAARALIAVPEVNSRFHDDALEIFPDCNIGVGTALGNEGLIVPVLHRAQTLDLFGVAQRLGELVDAARAGKLAPEAVRGGTFTISNHGVSGSLLAAPIIINQPQVAILGIGKLEKRARVETENGRDVVRVKPMCYLTLTLDHRALDAFQANTFLTAMVDALQNWA